MTSDPPTPNDLLIVVDTLATGPQRYEEFLEMGISESDLGFFHSFWSQECKELRGQSRQLYSRVPAT